MKIQMVDLKAQYHAIEEEIDAKIKEIIHSSHFIIGNNVTEFEKEIAAYYDTKHAIGVASGTDALHLAILGCGIGKGDEVITTPFTFIATAEAITYTGARPVFVDIDEKTLNIDVKKIEKAITKNTKAILPVHLFGLSADMEKIKGLADEYKLKIIEDCAQSFGAEYKGKKTGAIGYAGCFSFFPSKNLGCYGDGGMVIMNDDNMSEKIRMLRNHGQKVRYYHSVIGYNSRLDEIQAGILRVKLKRIDEYNKKRRENARLYTEKLKGVNIIAPSEPDGYYHVFHQYSVRTSKRDSIQNGLTKAGIASAIYYPVPLHLQESYKELGYKKGDFPVSEAAASDIISLPMYPELTAEQIDEVCKTIKELL
ncbi:MAG: DegT/DnrJ/EryC1/StrS family aminotransferase [Nitrospirae bacterium]|nr:DegT/DnrJ/EryC1/StrS family aminotransferase [Nitrospirota bacterium]